MKVFMVTEGIYSDYGVLCIFEKEEDAETYCESIKRYDRDPVRVEEKEFYPAGEVPTLKKKT
jgi:hypothetical protein